MTVIPWEDLSERRVSIDRPVALTIGVFDGLHIGHRKLIAGILQEQGERLALVVTFRPSPAMILAPRTFPGLILTWRQKLARLENLGVAAVVAIDFSEEMSNLSGQAFIGLLKENLAISKIVVGQNFRFGKGRYSGTDELKAMLSGTGTEVQVTTPVLWDDRIVSSSRIRMTIKEADFPQARSMLASPFSLDLHGLPASRERRGTLRIPRQSVTQVLPKTGAYAVTCVSAEGSRAGRCAVGEEALTFTVGDGRDIIAAVFQ